MLFCIFTIFHWLGSVFLTSKMIVHAIEMMGLSFLFLLCNCLLIIDLKPPALNEIHSFFSFTFIANLHFSDGKNAPKLFSKFLYEMIFNILHSPFFCCCNFVEAIFVVNALFLKMHFLRIFYLRLNFSVRKHFFYFLLKHILV